jgi:hypothetical protein
MALAGPSGGTLTATVSGDTSTLGAQKASSCASQNAKDAVYALTAPVDGTLTVKLAPKSWDAALAVRTTCTDVSSEVACVDVAGGGGAETWTASVKAGAAYAIVVDGAPTFGASSGAFTLTATLVPKGAEDACPGGVVSWAGGAFSLTGDTTADAHDFGGSCLYPTARDAAYAVTAPADGLVVLTLTPSGGWDPALLVETTCGSAASETACVDRFYDGDPEVLAYAAKSGSTRTVVVSSGLASGRGAYQLDGLFAPMLASASTEKCGGGDLAFSGSPLAAFVGGDTSSMGADHYTASGCGSSHTSPDAVYHLTAPQAGTLHLTLQPFGWDAQLFVRSGACGATGTLESCVDDAYASRAESDSFAVAKGDELWIFVKGTSGTNAGPFTLSASY